MNQLKRLLNSFNIDSFIFAFNFLFFNIFIFLSVFKVTEQIGSSDSGSAFYLGGTHI